MLEAALSSLGSFDATVLALLAVGVLAGIVVAVIPGLGGLFVLALLLPFTYGLDPFPAFALLLSAAAVIGTANTVTGILFGVPGNVGGVAVMFDGYPMAKKGKANQALAAGFTSSLIGGVIGVAVIALLLPLIRPLVLMFGPPEFFILVVAAIVLMAYTVQQNALKAIISGGLGLLCSFIGLEGATGTTRYTFGSLYLWDGVKLIPLIIGLFAVAEMLLLLRQGASVTDVTAARLERGGTLRGMIDAVRHWWTLLRSSAVGAVVGLLPGLGGETAQFIAYSQAARTSKRGRFFGTGEVEGVVAADASTNSKEAASLVPTLLFGIPGSAPMALLLTAFIIFGIRPGPGMLGAQLEITWFLLWAIVLSNVLATGVCLLLARQLSKLALIKVVYIAPVFLVAALFGAYTTSNHIGDIWVALFFGVAGYFMATQGYSRATFLIGLVLGPLLENNLLLSQQIHGWSFLTRPLVLVLLGAIVLTVLWPLIRRGLRVLRRRGRPPEEPSAERETPVPTPTSSDDQE